MLQSSEGMHDVTKLQIELTKKEANIQHLEGSLAEAHATNCRSQINNEETQCLRGKASQADTLQHELSCLYEEVQGALDIAQAALRPSKRSRCGLDINAHISSAGHS